MKKKIIYFDMDDVLVDFSAPLVNALNKKYGTSYTVKDLTDWNFAKIRPFDEKAYELLHDPEIYRNLKWKGEAEVVFRKFVEDDRYDVYILTDASSNPEIVAAKIEWITQNMPYFDPRRVIFSGHKHLQVGDYLVDDSPLTAKKVMKSSNLQLILFDMPYNQIIEAKHRITCLSELEKLVA